MLQPERARGVPPSDVEGAYRELASRLPNRPVGVVLGSGLGQFASDLEAPERIPFRDIPGMPECRVPGHAGILHIGSRGGRGVVVFEGRTHLYEGASVTEVSFAVRLLARIHAVAVVLTSAAGSVGAACSPGELLLVTDHLNYSGSDPARETTFGRREPLFPSRARVYEPRLIEQFSSLAFGLSITLRRGVLAAVRGPSYETPAEARALSVLGADAVCMSSVVEALAAVDAGLPVVGLAMITNRSGEDGHHDAVLDAAARGGRVLASLLGAALEDVAWEV